MAKIRQIGLAMDGWRHGGTALGGVAVVVLLALLGTTALAGVAGNRAPGASVVPAAASAPTCTDTTCGVTFTTVGGHTWTVPPRVTRARVTVEGAQGGGSSDATRGGKGARVVRTITGLTAGESLEISVGGQNGHNGGGAPGTFSGQGGGYSSVQAPGGAYELVAGGGGGAGNGDSGTGVIGGEGGAAGRVGLPGKDSGTSHGGSRGSGMAGGSGGAGPCADGDGGDGGPRTGGTGATGGGGGGGGWFGGGQGGAGLYCDGSGTGGGGGGGSSYSAGPGATFATGVRSGNGRVVVTYTNRVAAGAPRFTVGSGKSLTPGPPGALTGSTAPTRLTASLTRGPRRGSGPELRRLVPLHP